MNAAEAARMGRLQPSPKVTDLHLIKMAIVYVRQSTPQQVSENRESLARQYALAGHAAALGWPQDRVVVIDDDLGLSGRAPRAAPASSACWPKLRWITSG